ncbi:unnamed protein product, partial [Notodromas monacha]
MPRTTENSKAAAAAAKDLAPIPEEEDDKFQDTNPSPPERRSESQASGESLSSIWEALPLTTLQRLAEKFHLGHPATAAKADYAAQLERFQIPLTAIQDLSRGAITAPLRGFHSNDDDVAVPRCTSQRPQWLLDLQAPNLPKQRAKEDFEDFATRLRNALAVGKITDEHRLSALLENTLPNIQSTANRMYKRGIFEFEQLVEAVARRHPTPHLDRLKRFRSLRPEKGESFFNFGERLREEYENYLQLPLDDVDACEPVIQHILKEQLVNSAETGLKDELQKKWGKNGQLSWDDLVDVAEAYRLNHPSTATGQASGKTGSRPRVDLPPKQWCDHHKRTMRHGRKNAGCGFGNNLRTIRVPNRRRGPFHRRTREETTFLWLCVFIVKRRTSVGTALSPEAVQVTRLVETLFDFQGTPHMGSFLVLPGMREFPVILGRTILLQLPLTINLDGKRMFTGFHEGTRPPAKPSLQIGDGISFVDSSPQEREVVMRILCRHSPLMRQWSGRRGLFADFVVQIPTVEASPPAARQFRHSVERNKPFAEIIDLYLEAGILEPAASPFNAPAFLVDKKCLDPSAPAEKRFRLVEDYSKLNKLIKRLLMGYGWHVLDDLHQTGSRPAERNVEAVRRYPKPDTRRQMQQFLGLATYLRAHLPTNFAESEKVLRRTIPQKPATKIAWTPDAEVAFEHIKSVLADTARSGAALQAPDALSRISLNNASARVQPPEADRIALIDAYHAELGHAGWKKVYATIKQRFIWPRMRQDIRRRILACELCFKYNQPSQTVGAHMSAIESNRPRERLVLDFYGPLPETAEHFRYAIIAVDHFSKYMMAHPIEKADSQTVIPFLAKVFRQYGLFETVHTDCDSVFNGKAFKHFLKGYDIAQHIAQASHPEGNGCCERSIQTLSQIQAKAIQGQDEQWARHLADSVKAYNSTIHSATGVTPTEAMFGRRTILEADNTFGAPTLEANISQEELQQEAEKHCKRFINQVNTHKLRHFRPGDMIAVYPRLPTVAKHAANRRFRPQRIGPFMVISQEGHGVYHVGAGPDIRRVNAWEIVPYRGLPRAPNAGFEKQLGLIDHSSGKENIITKDDHRYAQDPARAPSNRQLKMQAEHNYWTVKPQDANKRNKVRTCVRSRNRPQGVPLICEKPPENPTKGKPAPAVYSLSPNSSGPPYEFGSVALFHCPMGFMWVPAQNQTRDPLKPLVRNFTTVVSAECLGTLGWALFDVTECNPITSCGAPPPETPSIRVKCRFTSSDIYECLQTCRQTFQGFAKKVPHYKTICGPDNKWTSFDDVCVTECDNATLPDFPGVSRTWNGSVSMWSEATFSCNNPWESFDGVTRGFTNTTASCVEPGIWKLLSNYPTTGSSTGLLKCLSVVNWCDEALLPNASADVLSIRKDGNDSRYNDSRIFEFIDRYDIYVCNSTGDWDKNNVKMKDLRCDSALLRCV